MATIWDITVLAAHLVSLLITIPGYMFILIVNFHDWMKNKRLEISDQLISGISLFNLLHRVLHSSLDFIMFAAGHYRHIHDEFAINNLFLSLMLGTLLFSTWLAIYFCLKIVNINYKVYIYIQRRFPKMFPWILLPSIVASVLISSPAALRLTRKEGLNSTDALQNADHAFLERLLDFSPYILFSSLCLFVFFSSDLNIILSLQRHIKQIHNTVGFRGQTVEAHVTAVKTITSLLVFNLFYFALLIFLIVIHLLRLTCHVVACLYALCHILGVPILIRGSSKLQKKMQSMMS